MIHKKIIFISFISCLVVSCIERPKGKYIESIDLCTEYSINDIWKDSIMLQNYFLEYFEEPNEHEITKNKLAKFVRIINYRMDDTCSIYTFKIGATCTSMSTKKTEPFFFNLVKSNSTGLNKNVVYLYERKVFYFLDFKDFIAELSNLYVIKATFDEENKTQFEYFDGQKYHQQFYTAYDDLKLEEIILKLK